MKDFHCRDVGMQCDWVAQGEDEGEILEKIERHAHDAHGLTVDQALETRVRTLIHDEDSDAHRQSMGEMIP